MRAVSGRLWRCAVPLAALLFGCTLRAGDFESANELYDQGKFSEAKHHYEKLIEAGQGSANVLYNLGNVDYRLGSIGRAVLNYERALILNPQHPEARANLQMLRQQSGAKLPKLPWIEDILTRQSLTVWTMGAAVAGWLAIFSIAFLVVRRKSDRAAGWWLLLVGASGFAISAAGVWFGLKNQNLAIITARQTAARLAPAASAGAAEELPAGSRVRVVSERGPWIYCELPNAGRGWIPQETLERVTPAPL